MSSDRYPVNDVPMKAQLLTVVRRGLAILPQVPVLSNADVKKELALRRAAERAVAWKRQVVREQAATPQFGSIKRPSNVLKVYARKRTQLTPRDKCAAFYALGRLNQHAAYKLALIRFTAIHWQ